MDVEKPRWRDAPAARRKRHEPPPDRVLPRGVGRLLVRAGVALCRERRLRRPGRRLPQLGRGRGVREEREFHAEDVPSILRGVRARGCCWWVGQPRPEGCHPGRRWLSLFPRRCPHRHGLAERAIAGAPRLLRPGGGASAAGRRRLVHAHAHRATAARAAAPAACGSRVGRHAAAAVWRLARRELGRLPQANGPPAWRRGCRLGRLQQGLLSGRHPERRASFWKAAALRAEAWVG
mmetsp:Transcript_25231/g.81369  ORF Transcript_25231/g.81369 Transcript_25231/m.81369 type:complete len:235 (-) Transcript_25231:447-1151(-)